MQVPADVRDRVASILEEAASILDTYGWISGGYGDQSNGYCAVGAIAAVPGCSLLFEEEDRYALRLVAKRVASIPISTSIVINEEAVLGWNDELGRTLGEVTDTLRSVAKDLRNES